MKVRISIKDMAFNPATVTLAAAKPATCACWTNDDGTDHSVVLDDGSATSKILQPGESFEHEFIGPGSYPYHCGIHHHMKGTVVVE